MLMFAYGQRCALILTVEVCMSGFDWKGYPTFIELLALLWTLRAGTMGCSSLIPKPGMLFQKRCTSTLIIHEINILV